MSLYRVVISFIRDQLSFMAERGALAMTPGQALDDVFSHLQIDRTKIQNFKCWIERPESLEAYSVDSQFLDCVGSRYTVREEWTRRNG